MWKRESAILVLISLLPAAIAAQIYQYDHQLQPKTSADSYTPFARETREAFQKAYRAAGRPRVVILFDGKAIQDLGGLTPAGRSEVEITHEAEAQLDADAAWDAYDATASAQSSASVTAKGKSRSRTLVSFRDFVPSAPAGWSPETVGGFSRALLEEALAEPLLDAGVILIDRKTALDFHAQEIFSAMKQDRLEAQRDALKKVADLLLSVRVNSTRERVVKVSGDEELAVPALSARILAIADARLVDVVSNRSVTRLVEEYNIDRADPEARAEILAYAVMNQLIHYWNREK